jgi:nucleoside-diphosphate-sugar epimerase
MKALVTGGGGFLGRYVAEQLLERGDAVSVFARGAYPELEEAGAQMIRGDLQDLAAVQEVCQGMDVVFHVAAKTGHWGTWESYFRANVVGTQHVIAACQATSVPRLVYTSSPSVVFGGQSFEGTDGDRPADESLPYPVHYESFYPQSKAMAERLVREASHDGLLTVVLRPHLIFGPRDNHLLPRLIARAKTGKLPQVGDGTNKADLTYVEDAARAHLLAAEALEPGSPAAGSVYFISQDDPVNVWEWIGHLLSELGLPPIRRQVPLWAARAAGAALELTYRTLPLQGEPFITRFLATEVAKSHYFDISRAKRELGYQLQFTMEEATQRTVEWLRQSI